MNAERDSRVIEYVVFCIENAAISRGESPEHTYTLLRDSGLIEEYILPLYDALHTQSKEYIVRDLIERMKERGV